MDRAALVIDHTMRAARAKPQVSEPDEFSAPTQVPRTRLPRRFRVVEAHQTEEPREERVGMTPNSTHGCSRRTRYGAVVLGREVTGAVDSEVFDEPTSGAGHADLT